MGGGEGVGTGLAPRSGVAKYIVVEHAHLIADQALIPTLLRLPELAGTLLMLPLSFGKTWGVSPCPLLRLPELAGTLLMLPLSSVSTA
jgi:hypothetical protein